MLADDTGPTDEITDLDERAMHSWLSSMLVKDDKVHFAYWVDKSPQDQVYKRYGQTTGALEEESEPFLKPIAKPSIWSEQTQTFENN